MNTRIYKLRILYDPCHIKITNEQSSNLISLLSIPSNLYFTKYYWYKGTYVKLKNVNITKPLKHPYLTLLLYVV